VNPWNPVLVEITPSARIYPKIFRFPDIVTLFGKPIVTFPVEPDTSISFVVPVMLLTPAVAPPPDEEIVIILPEFPIVIFEPSAKVTPPVNPLSVFTKLPEVP